MATGSTRRAGGVADPAESPSARGDAYRARSACCVRYYARRAIGCRRGAVRRWPPRLARLVIPPGLTETLAPLQRTIAQLTTEIATIDTRLTAQAADDAVVQRLQSVPGVGPVVALTFRATLDQVKRFTHAGQVSALLGLVPLEDSSAERRHRGHITKAGPRELRSLLVQAAWACWRSMGSGTLHAWVERLAARRGRRIAVVALARRLSRILYAVWRDDAVV